MSVLEEVLLEEYDRSMRVISAIKAEQKTLPKGSVQEKLIGGRKYLYLQYRDGNKIRSDYIKKADMLSFAKTRHCWTGPMPVHA